MRFFFSYLFQSPLIRLTAFWMFIGVIGVSLFYFKVSGMRADLLEANLMTESHIVAIQKIDQQKIEEREALKKVIEKIEKFRPSVPDLLGFIEHLESLATKRGLDMQLNTIQSGNRAAVEEEEVVTYKATFISPLDDVKAFVRDFEESEYAVEIQTLDISEHEDGNFKLDLIFILYVNLS